MSTSRTAKSLAALFWGVCDACSSGQRTNVAPSLQPTAAGSFHTQSASDSGATAASAGSGVVVKPGATGSSVVGAGGLNIGVAGGPAAPGGGGSGAAVVSTAATAGAGTAAMKATAADGGSAVAGAGSSGPAPGMLGTDAPPCTAKPGMKRGKSTQMVMAGGMSRTYVYYAPMAVNANKPVPLVVVPHGFTMSGEEMFGITGYDKVADRDGFVVAYPDGEGDNPWNCGAGILAAPPTARSRFVLSMSPLARPVRPSLGTLGRAVLQR